MNADLLIAFFSVFIGYFVGYYGSRWLTKRRRRKEQDK